MNAGLYTRDLLALAADIPHLGPLVAAEGAGSARSMVCGSEIDVEVRLDGRGAISALGWRVQACAVGQAAAALVSANAIGASVEDVREARDAFARLLTTPDSGPPLAGRFAPLIRLAGVRFYPRRHASAGLALRALEAAIEDALARRAASAGLPVDAERLELGGERSASD